jgi:hypothetical protein
MSVPLDRFSHAKLCALASLRGEDRGKIAADLIRRGLKGVTVRDERTQAEVDDDSDSAAAATDAA